MITFKFLRELQQKERDGNDLQPLDENFYEKVEEYLQRKEKVAGVENLLDFSEEKRIEHSKAIIKDIFNRRERKIINNAILNIRSGIKPKNMLSEEQELFDSLVNLLNQNRRKLETLLPEEKVEEKQEAVEETREERHEEEIEAEEGEEPEEKVQEEQPKDLKTLRIKFLFETPPFLDRNQKIHGPFKEGDTAELPADVGEILLKSKRAELI